MEEMNETLWKFMEKGILADGNRHDALVYFGRRTSRSTLIEKVTNCSSTARPSRKSCTLCWRPT